MKQFTLISKLNYLAIHKISIAQPGLINFKIIFFDSHVKPIVDCQIVFRMGKDFVTLPILNFVILSKVYINF